METKTSASAYFMQAGIGKAMDYLRRRPGRTAAAHRACALGACIQAGEWSLPRPATPLRRCHFPGIFPGRSRWEPASSWSKQFRPRSSTESRNVDSVKALLASLGIDYTMRSRDIAVRPEENMASRLSSDTDLASVITSKAANGYHFKTGQRK